VIVSGVKIEIAIDDSDFQGAMRALADRGRNLAPALKSIGEALRNSTENRFKEQTGPDGRPWAPLSPQTIKRKKANKDKILVERGRLAGSIAYRVTGNELAVGTSLIYGAIHQLGGEIKQGARTQTLAFHGKGGAANKFKSHKSAGKSKTSVSVRFANIGARVIKMPARPYLGVNARDKRTIERILTRHLERDP
jgi:phage virion morphogenesis protein